MSKGIADSAVGAILEIPDTLLNRIQAAERHIESLQITSNHAADAVKKHWGVTAVEGLEVFIQKLSDAQQAMKGLSDKPIDININTNAEQAAKQADSATKQIKSDLDLISKSVQILADSFHFNKAQAAVEFLTMTFGQLEKKIKDADAERKKLNTDDPMAMRYNNLIAALKEFLELKKRSEQQLKTKLSESDKPILEEQKRLLAEQLDLRRQINDQRKRVAAGEVTGSEKLNEERATLQKLFDQYAKNAKARKKLGEAELSVGGQDKFDLAKEKQRNELLAIRLKSQRELNSELLKASEYVSQAQASKARISNSDEGRVQRQLNTDYKEMIKVIKEIGEIRAKAAEQGRSTNAEERELIQTLIQRYRLYREDVARVSSTFSVLAEARRKAYEQDHSEQLKRNAVALADAHEKAAQSATKHGLALRDTANIESRIQSVNSQLQNESQKLNDIANNALVAKQRLDEFIAANNGFKLTDAYSQRTKLEAELANLNYQKSAANDNDRPFFEHKFNATKRAIDELQTKIQTFKSLEAQADVTLQTQQSQQNIANLTAELHRLEKELLDVRNANASINAEIEKGSTVKSLAKEYANLTKRLQEVNKSLNDFQAAGGDTNKLAFGALAGEMMSIMARRKEIEKMGIAEVNQYREQMAQNAAQQELSAFVQAEAQKTAIAKQEAEKRAQDAANQHRTSYQYAMAMYNNIGKSQHSSLADTYENRERVIKNLEAAIRNLKTTDADYEKKLKDLTAALNTLRDAQNKVKDAMKAPAKTTTLADANQAIKIAEQTKTLKDYESAYKMLIEVMKQTPQGHAFDAMNRKALEMKTHIDEIKKKMGEFRNESSRTNNVIGQLQGRIAAAFSISAIGGFLKKVTEVRAQFELQRVALGAIIQDRDEANKIFTQVQNMALESPFSIMQLEKATKQIAAFGFETKKLVPTMKMFADIAAGLGVEIDRLNLVMGHLKARNFLEGTMVRQFTNMGFNILGELAKYYKELEGKMVSVAEVQDRVKKKMVSFADVEEVLKRVTSAGGMFYDMQKKQSDSIWGQMQRITDAYDLMLNDIGQSNEGVIKSVLTTVRSLISHWRTLAPILASVTGMMAMAFSVKAIGFMISSVRQLNAYLAATALRMKLVSDIQRAASFASWVTSIGFVIGVLGTLAGVIAGVRMEQNALNETLKRVKEEGYGNMLELTTQYRQLADTVKDTSKPYGERKKALEELRRIYGDILPKEMLEIEYIRKTKDGYDEAAEAIRKFSEAKTKANMKAEIDNKFGKDLNEAVTVNVNDFVDKTFDAFRGLSQFENVTKDHMKAAVRRIMSTVAEELINGDISLTEARAKFKKAFMDSFAISEADYKTISEKFNRGLDSIFTNVFDAKRGDNVAGFFGILSDGIASVVKDAEKEYGSLKTMFSDPLDLNPQVKEMNNLRDAVKSYTDAAESLKDVKLEEGEFFDVDEEGYIANTYGEGSQEWKAIEEYNAAVKELRELNDDFSVSAEQLADSLSSEAGSMEFTSKIINDNLIKAIDDLIGRAENDAIRMWFKRLRGEIEQTTLDPIKQDVIDTQRTIAQRLGLSMSVFDKMKLAGITSYDDVKKKAKQLSDEATENIKRIHAIRAELIGLGYDASEAQRIAESRVGDNKTTEERYKQEAEALLEAAKAYGYYDKSKKSSKSSDAELKRWKDLEKLIEDTRAAYEKYRKSFNVEDSNKRIEELYGAAFEELGYNIKQFYKDGKYDIDEMVYALEILKGQTNAATEERKKFRSELERKIGNAKVEIDVKMQEESEKKLKADLDEMFANYELTKELKGLGVPVDLIFMLGGEPMDLDKMRKRLQTEFEAVGGKSAPDNIVKMYEDSFKKIADLENKQNQQQLKNYVKYLTESMGERAQIEIKALQDINKIREDATLDQFSKEQAIMQRRKKMSEELSKMDLDNLKSSDVYVSVFKDLERASKEQLQYVLNKLRELQSTFKDLSPAQVKSIASEMKKIDDALADKDSVKRLGTNLRDAVSYARKRNTLLREQTSIQNTINKRTESLTNAEVYLEELQLNLKGIQNESSDEWKVANDRVQDQQRFVKDLQDEIETLKNKLKEYTDEINEGESKWKGFQAGLSKVHQGMNQLKDSFDAIYNGLDSMGLVNDAFRDTYESASDILGGLDTFMGGLESIDWGKPFSIITGGVKALGGVLQSIGGVFGIGDKKKERQIQKLVDKVDTLDKAYQRLEKSIDAAYTIDDYKAGYAQMQDTLEAEKAAYEEIIRLEQAKKKTDKKKIEEYQSKIEEVEERQRQLREDLHERWGSTNDVWGEANSWVDAWLDVFKECGTGLDSLNESWDAFYENLVKKQATSAIVSKRMEGFISEINKAIEANTDEYGYVDAFKDIGERFKKEFGDMNQQLIDFFNYAGITGGNGELILSDLQKGIQNITEPQAAAIEAYLNSMRFAVFRHTEQLDTLILTIQAQYGAGAENPVVTELKGIRGVLDSIDRKLGSVINSQGRNAVIRVGA